MSKSTVKPAKLISPAGAEKGNKPGSLATPARTVSAEDFARIMNKVRPFTKPAAKTKGSK